MLIKRKNAFFWPAMILSLLAALTGAGLCLAQGNYKLEASTDKQSVTLGESLTLTVTIRSDSGVIAQPREPEMPDFQINARSSSSRVSIVNGVQSVEAGYHYSLRPVKTGKLTIGKFTLDYTDAAGVARKAETEPLVIDVIPEKAEEETPAQVESAVKKEQLAEQRIISNHLIIITAVIITAFALIWFVIWQNSKKERKMAATSNGDGTKLQITDYLPEADQRQARGTNAASSVNAPKPVTDPSILLRSIISLKNTRDYQQMFVQIPRYIKTAAGEQNGGSFAELTNQEFLSRIGRIPRLSSRSAEIGDILSLCDMVNYAKYSPGENEIETFFQNLNNISRLFERGGN
ncbi:MAG: hypothetical protein A2008_05270 [Candidatus Wallbacteria bacterium GWC2_49_35]|uniref:Protein BatD n=1 Tax=Candidatus Wallbacteria bacterium GWC2_49_35 TaxID=1817813 RepID=A0A1F7WUH0_9BACT|nr:MAG: hypothetical protein A2008_05270 [Candidatus Wallbacteria bacterium GWC2_49_35]HBC76559.1 hypothetical protein [Candidatus Wallbacteria bacterium]